MSETLPKAQRTRGLSSYHKFKQRSWSSCIFRISTKHQLQNLNQTSASPKNFKILTKPSFKISTKIQLHNLYKISAEKGGQTPAANLAWTSTSKSGPNLVLKVWTKVFWPNVSFQICNKLLPARSSSAKVTTLTSFEESVSESVGPIKITYSKNIYKNTDKLHILEKLTEI